MKIDVCLCVLYLFITLYIHCIIYILYIKEVIMNKYKYLNPDVSKSLCLMDN